MRLAGRLLGAVALVAALSARADVRAVLLEPRAGEVLRGGTTATVAWSAAQLPPFVEEWEAFLSVDGGAYYAYRITPHLDVAQRRFTFEVPNVATDRARLLIRAGDERREIELELPVTFVIERDEARALTAVQLEIEETERGEAAREGERGVIAWIDGDRDGSNLDARDALELPCTLGHAFAAPARSESVEEAAARSIPRPGETWHLTLAGSFPAARSAPRDRGGREVLLAYGRLNI